MLLKKKFYIFIFLLVEIGNCKSIKLKEANFIKLPSTNFINTLYALRKLFHILEKKNKRKRTCINDDSSWGG